MTAYVALLRAVNVGGTSKLPMAELKSIAEDLGFASPRTFIASGNLVFTSGKSEAAVRAALEKRLAEHMGKPVAVMVRTAAELAAVVKANPFKDAPGRRVLVTFLPDAPPRDALDAAKGLDGERLALGKREIYTDYRGTLLGRSKLRIPATATGTSRNMNSVAKLAEMAKELP
ncbi:DUF1697 domain-containing protein [Sphingomonas sp.]|uniref:DUF1697 domain-containing protein n=1 Tax=Sphingomonas sp. TaxID=28214 RepID=UPI0017F9ADC6|nr:DUF1697 domain-containing protein [Sphingomonas sp.]MBA3511062.1 DUF1697 domain-containing protein [Sphingomonas sp.]